MLNRGDRMERFDCIFIFLVNTIVSFKWYLLKYFGGQGQNSLLRVMLLALATERSIPPSRDDTSSTNLILFTIDAIFFKSKRILDTEKKNCKFNR